ncbi:NAD(P)H-quinone oxidoreductase [Paenibacillus sp. FSL W8-0194]|uniref:NAD(P)H-quinone oxidoreductase n=1 Tax=Paenibacillus sp. FSL W8-0194 TaxID=2921711 RepID=UPI0030DD5B7D
MLGVTVNRLDERRSLEVKEVEVPRPAAGELLIQVHAAAVNRTDIVNRQGKAGYMTHPILGVEVAGTVTEASGDTGFKAGDRVMGLVNGGGYAEYAVMPADRAMKIPESFTFAEAAAIPEVFLTAYQTLFWIGKLRENESVLIHAGASGVGTAAIQLAKKLRNAKVIVTAGSRQKLDFCQKLGADVLINYKEQNFDEEVLKATEGQGVDVILDFVGADYWTRNLNSIKKGGRWVLIGILGGSTVEKVDLFPLMSKMIEITGTLLTPRDDNYKARLTRDFYQAVLPYFEKREILPVVDTSFPLEKAEEAHEHMLGNRNIGKIILDVNTR